MIVVNMLDFLKNRLSSDDPEIILGDSLDLKAIIKNLPIT